MSEAVGFDDLAGDPTPRELPVVVMARRLYESLERSRPSVPWKALPQVERSRLIDGMRSVLALGALEPAVDSLPPEGGLFTWRCACCGREDLSHAMQERLWVCPPCLVKEHEKAGLPCPFAGCGPWPSKIGPSGPMGPPGGPCERCSCKAVTTLQGEDLCGACLLTEAEERAARGRADPECAEHSREDT